MATKSPVSVTLGNDNITFIRKQENASQFVDDLITAAQNRNPKTIGELRIEMDSLGKVIESKEELIREILMRNREQKRKELELEEAELQLEIDNKTEKMIEIEKKLKQNGELFKQLKQTKPEDIKTIQAINEKYFDNSIAVGFSPIRDYMKWKKNKNVQ